jgi:hypothetical protein
MYKWALCVLDSPYTREPPKEVGLFGPDEDVLILNAIELLKAQSPGCMPTVARVPLEPVELIYCVKRGSEYDAMFLSLRLAEEWCDRMNRKVWERYSANLSLGRPEHYWVFCFSSPQFNTPCSEPTKPKSIWEWIREPAL